MRPVFIPISVQKYNKSSSVLKSEIRSINENFRKLFSDTPDISIVIPAYNEEENILKTLYSLSNTKSRYSIEVIVVNNNSKDKTEELINACGVICVNETKQGITNARNAGLAAAKGKYIINADADTIYPESWIDNMIDPLHNNNKIALTYGRFSFIPEETPRILYFFYEYLSDFNRHINRLFKEEALNVYGFNSACRREQCLNVDGFVHPTGTNEDGWLAMKLRKAGFGKLHWVTKSESIVWTGDRRIIVDGGIYKSTYDRFIKYFNFKHIKKS
ncbi:glycosyltransferase family 2 protein [Pedobacter jejuensis]|uniref:Glycosyltransferase family 2 protein n=1 Tax=Pedobacter jejuensis TaxID=1268550 RepID=A0A3N0BUN5_9SPHI|nr:glycosyltransferase family 2 protein [Pedobacter jejuensis]RNL52590.1 glycosyltransferase family 2 protein [Pedobacter jejuensis]